MAIISWKIVQFYGFINNVRNCLLAHLKSNRNLIMMLALPKSFMF